MVSEVGEDALREVLIHAEAGQFDERSWTYWHYRLGLAAVGEVPPLPVRMSRKFKPRLDVLPPAQKRLWPQLRRAPDLGFTLYGGTAIALRLGHRDSADFDFFSEGPLDRKAIETAFPFMARSTTLQDRADTRVVLVANGQSAEQVKVSFFGAIAFGRVGEPEAGLFRRRRSGYAERCREEDARRRRESGW